jgi:hypothetical protein
LLVNSILYFEIKLTILRRESGKHYKTISDWIANCVPLKVKVLLFVTITWVVNKCI